MKISKIIALPLLLVIGTTFVTAQNTVMTPYSRYGYGILSDNATSAQKSMGGVGYAMNSGRQINVKNPASYAAMDSLTFLFDMGAQFTKQWSNETVDGVTTSQTNLGGGLDYVTMQIPILKGWGASLGLLPFASTGYAFGNDITHGVAARQGSGGINQLYIGTGYTPLKGFNIGFNIGYLFGTTTNDTYAVTSAGSTTLFQRQLSVRDWYLTIGAQYDLRLPADQIVTFGLVYSPGNDLHGHYTTLSYDASVEEETQTLTTDLNGNYSLPETWGAGIAWRKGSMLLVEADFTYQPWSKAKYAGTSSSTTAESLADRTNYAVGVQYQPTAHGGYFRRMQYRAGAFYNNDYLKVMGNRLREIGASIGFGLPVPGFKTVVNLGFEWRHRQGTPQAMIKEDYFNITLGINFNELWFRKSKIY